MKIERWHVKYIVATAGLLGIYAGAFVGMGLLSLREHATAGYWMLATQGFLGLVGGIAAVLGCDYKLGKLASHVDWFKVPAYWIAAGAGLYAVDAILEKALGGPLPPFVSNLVLWSAGAYAVWTSEQKGQLTP